MVVGFGPAFRVDFRDFTTTRSMLLTSTRAQIAFTGLLGTICDVEDIVRETRNGAFRGGGGFSTDRLLSIVPTYCNPETFCGRLNFAAFALGRVDARK